MRALPSVLAFFAFTAWALGDGCLKLFSEEGADTFLIMAVMGMGVVLFLLLKNAFKGSLASLHPRNRRWVFLRSTASILSSFFFTLAYTHLMLSEAYMIEFLAPFSIALGAALFMKEPFPPTKIMLSFLGLLGCGVALAPDLHNALMAHHDNQLLGYGAAIAGTLMFSSIQLISRKLVKTESSDCILFFASLFTGLVGLTFTNFHLDRFSWQTFIFILFIPAMNVTGGILMLAAHRTGKAANVSLFHYWQLVVGGLLGYFVWDTLPTRHLILGSALIILSGLLMMRLDQKEKKVA